MLVLLVQMTYTGAIRSCERSGRWEEGLAFMDDMKERGIRPDTRAHNVLLSAVCKAGRWDEAKALLHSMQELGCVADDYTFQAVVGGPGKGTRRKEDVVEMVKRMTAGGAGKAERRPAEGPYRKGRRRRVGEGGGSNRK